MKSKTLKMTKTKAILIVKKVASDMDLVFNERIKDTFHFKKSGNFFSFGNVISVKMKSVDEGKQKISVISSSSTTIQLLDWGTNGNLEVEFIEMLNDLTQK